MQDVGEQHNIEGFVFEREVDAIELLNRDVGLWSNKDVHAGDRSLRALLADQAIDQAVATSDIEHGQSVGKHGGEFRRQHLRSTREHQLIVEQPYCAHVRSPIRSDGATEKVTDELRSPSLTRVARLIWITLTASACQQRAAMEHSPEDIVRRSGHYERHNVFGTPNRTLAHITDRTR
jgi:hypothetical protein